MASRSSSVASTTNEFLMIPATFAHTSSRPVDRSAVWARSSIDDLLLTSVGTTSASGTRAATSSSASALRSASTTLAPASA